jgi:ABC-type glycerol-3-phosphate transport system substrate-binding protein
MRPQRFLKAGQAASALPLALALALIPPAASAQERKIVPFLTAESSPEAVQQILDLIAQFEEQNPDIGIELQLMSNDIRAARIINSVAVGDELGIFEIERRLVPDFTQAGYLLPLDSIVENVGEENFIPGSLLYWPFDGHLYQFTSDLSAGTLYWREDLFEEAGLAEPDSYERLLEASERLDGQNGVSGNAFEASNNGGVQRFVTFLWQNCGDFYTKEGDLALDRDGSRQAVEDYAALNQYTPNGSHSWGALDPINAYAAGRVGMALFPGRLGYQIATNAPDIAEVTGNREARVARGGEGPRVVYGAVTSYAIGSNVRHPEEAKKFLEFLFTGDQLLQYAMGVPGHIAPAIKSVQAQMLEQDNPYIRDYRDWVETILEATTYFNAEAQNMGSITDECEFEKSLVPMPWSSRVMGQSPVTSTMFQRIQLQDTPVDEAYADAVETFRTEMEAWKAENPWFEEHMSKN